jgi:hypothetical protein
VATIIDANRVYDVRGKPIILVKSSVRADMTRVGTVVAESGAGGIDNSERRTIVAARPPKTAV